jgi:hypothetical protein
MSEIGVLELLNAETVMYSAALEDAERAPTATAHVNELAAAVEHAFACLEHVSALRDRHPAQADQLAERWRTLTLATARLLDQARRDRRAELRAIRRKPATP